MTAGATQGLKDWAVLAWVHPRMSRKLRTNPSQSITQFTQLGGHRMGTLPSQITAEQGCVSWGLEDFGEGPQVGHTQGESVFGCRKKDALWEL